MVAKHCTISFLIKFGHVVIYIYIYISYKDNIRCDLLNMKDNHNVSFR